MRQDIYKKIHSRFQETLFSDFPDTIWVYLKASNVKGVNYDKFLNVGYTRTQQSPIPVEAYIRQLQPNSLIMRELGLTISGAIEIFVTNNDAELIKIAEKITYKYCEYSTYNKALGNKVQITQLPTGHSRVVLFRAGT
jgi:hypothetical protein